MAEPKTQSAPQKKSRVRYPSTLWIDKIEFEPEISGEVTRTSYDLELTEYDMKVLYEGLKERLENKIYKATRIRFTGRQDFQ
jgi:hypothetical protein